MQRTVVVALVLLAAASAAASADSQKQEFEKLESIRPGNVYRQTPTLQTLVHPAYTPEALQAKVEGDVGLEVVLTPDGTVGEVRITRSLDREHGLDDQAVAAARQWQFARDGRPAPVTFRLALQFRLPHAPSDANLEFEKDATRDDVAGLVKPTVVRDVKPTYTPEAMRSRLQGAVDVQVVVGTDGSVTRARVVRSAWASDAGRNDDLRNAAGLVDTALAAAKAWRFAPGTLNGTPVPVLTTATLRFRLG